MTIVCANITRPGRLATLLFERRADREHEAADLQRIGVTERDMFTGESIAHFRAAVGANNGTTHALESGMSRIHSRISFALAFATLVGCAASSSYLYAPQGTRYWSDGYPTTAIAVPPEAPQGKVEVTSFGITEITPDGAGPVAALHVRLAISNDGDATPWTLTTSDQLVEIAGEGRSRPLFVNTDVQTLPTVTIGQRERRVLDFYYPLPANIRDEESLPAFEFLWQVTTPLRPFASRTRFERLEQEGPATHTDVIFWSGWGPYWWHDPIYRDVVFIHHRPHVIYRSPRVIVTQPPRAHYRAIRDHRR